MTSDPKAYQVSAKLPKNTSFGQLLSNKLKTLHNETQNKTAQTWTDCTQTKRIKQ